MSHHISHITKPTRNARINRTHPLYKGLIRAYLLNEGSGVTAFDYSSQRRNLALNATAPPMWRDGLTFDGVNDRAVIPQMDGVKTIAYRIKTSDNNLVAVSHLGYNFYIDGVAQSLLGLDKVENGDFEVNINTWGETGTGTLSRITATSGDGSANYLRYTIANNSSFDRFYPTDYCIDASSTFLISFWYRITPDVTGSFYVGAASDMPTLANSSYGDRIFTTDNVWKFACIVQTTGTDSGGDIGFVKIGDVGDGTMRFDIDQVRSRKITPTISDGWHMIVTTSDDPILTSTYSFLGRRNYTTSPAARVGAAYYKGAVDCYYAWDRVLSDAEIAALSHEPYDMFHRHGFISLASVNTYTSTTSIDAVIQALGLTSTVALDALLLQSFPITANIDAILAVLQTTTVDIDALLKKVGVVSTANIDALLQQLNLTTTANLDAILSGGTTTSVNLDALLQAVQLTTANIDALLQQLNLTSTANIDALLQASTTKTVSLDALLQALDLSAVTALDALLSQSNTVTVSIDAVLQLVNITSSTSIDALLQQAGITVTTGLDAKLVELTTFVCNIDALLQSQGLTAGVSIDALLRYTGTATANVDALLQKTLTSTAGIDALLQAADLSSTTSIDSLLMKSATSTTSIDSILQQVVLKTLGLDAILSGGTTASAFLDALLQKVYTMTSSLDAQLVITDTVSIDMDVILKLIGTVTVSLDAILQSLATGSRYTFYASDRTRAFEALKRTLRFTT
jgi:hypothetical protein